MDELHFVNPQNVHHALRAFMNGKSPGPDNISPAIMKQLPDIILNPIVELMKAQLAIGYTPRIWRTGNIAFLQKPGKKILSDPRA